MVASCLLFLNDWYMTVCAWRWQFISTEYWSMKPVGLYVNKNTATSGMAISHKGYVQHNIL